MGIKNFSSNITKTLSEIQSKNYKFTDSKKFTTIYFSGAVIIILLLKIVFGGSSLDLTDPKLRWYDDGKTRIFDVGPNLKCTSWAMSSKYNKPLYLKKSLLIPCDSKNYNCALIGNKLRRCVYKR